MKRILSHLLFRLLRNHLYYKVMKIFLHAFYTWLIAIAVSIVFLLISNSVYKLLIDFNSWALGRTLIIIFVSYVSAGPALLLSILFLSLLTKSNSLINEKLILWHVIVMLSVFLNILIGAFALGVINDLSFIFSEFWTVFPASTLAIVVRNRQFVLLNTKSAQYETNTV